MLTSYKREIVVTTPNLNKEFLSLQIPKVLLAYMQEQGLFANLLTVTKDLSPYCQYKASFSYTTNSCNPQKQLKQCEDAFEIPCK